MKPAPFKYIEAADEKALKTALADSGDDARLLAGGQSLVPMMNFRVVSPAVLIDINRISALSYIDCNNETLRIGALTRHAMLEDSEAILLSCPLLSEAVHHVAHRAIRNRGTIGGTLALAYPGAELPLALVTLGAGVHLCSQRAERRMHIEDFIVGALDTALTEDEYIRNVEIRLPPVGSAASFVESARRHGDFAIAAAAAVAGRDPQGRLNYMRAGVSGGTGAPKRLSRLEDAVIGGKGRDDAIAEAACDAIGTLEVFGDHHYPEDYRRHVLRGVLQRALKDAIGKSGAPYVQ